MRGAADARIRYQSFTDPDADRAYFTRLGAYLGSVTSPGCTVEVSGIQPGAQYPGPVTNFRCAARVIANALAAEEQGYDAFVIGNFTDAGLAEARSAVRIPVIGLGEATMLHACTLGRRIGLVAVTPVHIPCHEDQIVRHGLDRRVIAVQAVQADTGRFNRAFDDEAEYRSLREAFAGQATSMLGLGIDVIIPAGGYPMLLFAREPSFTIGGATVLNGLPVAVAAAETAIRLGRLNGTGPSRRTAYALPPAEAVADLHAAFPAAPAGPAGPAGGFCRLPAGPVHLAAGLLPPAARNAAHSRAQANNLHSYFPRAALRGLYPLPDFIHRPRTGNKRRAGDLAAPGRDFAAAGGLCARRTAVQG
jgi:allantoin racemase